MPGEDKPTQQTRQRKKAKKSRSKGKSQSSRPGPSVDGQGDLLAPPLLQPAPKKVVEEKRKEPEVTVEEESSVAICLQVLLPYLLAGMGMVMAGMVLDYVQVRVSVGQTVPQKYFASVHHFGICRSNSVFILVFHLYKTKHKPAGVLLLLVISPKKKKKTVLY